MKTLEHVNDLLKAFEFAHGLPVLGAQQGSAAWMNLKLGVISASNASKVVAGATTEGRHTYMAELVAQVATSIFEEINSKHLDWGNQYEDAARSSYEFTTGLTVTQLPFVFKDERFRIGCSPDGLVTATKGVEIKCPSNTANYIKFLAGEKVKPEYDWQIQFSMWVLGAEEYDMAQFDPRVESKPLHFCTFKKDKEKHAKFDDLVPKFIEDMDKMLETCGLVWGDQWLRLRAKQVAEAV